MDEFQNVMNRLKRYFEDLEDYKSSDLSDKKDFYAASMIVFSIINDGLNLAEIFMSKKAMSAPISYKDMIERLAEKKYIDEPLSLKIKIIIGKRNVIAHEYGELKKEDLIELIKKMNSVLDFAIILSKKY